MTAEPRGAGRRLQGGAGDSDFPLYLREWLRYRGMSAADLSRATGLGESQVSRWLAGATMPDVTSCRRIAHAIRRRLLEVLVAAGQITQDEADNVQPIAPPPAPPVVQKWDRIAAVLKDPATPEATRVKLRVLIELAEQVAGIEPGQQ